MVVKCEECLDTGTPRDKEQVYFVGYCSCIAGQSLVFDHKLEKVLESDTEAVLDPLVE